MSSIDSLSISISITESSSDGSSNTSAGSSAQAGRNPFLDPNGPFANLDLTAQQQQQIAQIFGQSAAGQSASGSSDETGSSSSSSSTKSLFSEINAVLTPQQQQTFKSDLQSLKSGHRHHHGGGSSSAADPLSQLDLTSAQQTQIGQIVAAAQSSGESPSATLGQIDSVLTPAQQQHVVSLFAAGTSSGATSPNSQGYVINTSA